MIVSGVWVLNALSISSGTLSVEGVEGSDDKHVHQRINK